MAKLQQIKAAASKQLPSPIASIVARRFIGSGLFCIVGIVIALLYKSLPGFFFVLIPAAGMAFYAMRLRYDYLRGEIYVGEATCVVSFANPGNVISKTVTAVFRCEDGSVINLEAAKLHDKPLVENVQYVLYIPKNNPSRILAYEAKEQR